MPNRDEQPNDTASSDTDEVSNVPIPEQPPMIDDEDDDPVEQVSTDDLSVQGGD